MTKKIIPCLVTVTLLLVLCNCARPVPSFELTNGPFKLRGTTIAVLAGLNNELSTLFAACVSDSLKKQSTFRVLSQQQIAQKLTFYPFDIRGPYTAAYFSIEQDYEKTDIDKLKEISWRLGSDYLYIIWVPSNYWSGNRRLYNILEIAQLYEFPAGREVGRSGLRIPVIRDKGGSCCLMSQPVPGDTDIEDRLKIEADKIAAEIAKKTGTAKNSL